MEEEQPFFFGLSFFPEEELSCSDCTWLDELSEELFISGSMLSNELEELFVELFDELSVSGSALLEGLSKEVSNELSDELSVSGSTLSEELSEELSVSGSFGVSGTIGSSGRMGSSVVFLTVK